MSNWLGALGRAALTGSDMIGRNRELERQARLDQEARESRLIEQALRREQLDMQQDQLRRERGKELLDLAGPDSILDAAGEQTVREAGFGSRLEAGRHDEQMGVDPVLGTPARVSTMIGARVMPTRSQADEIAERGRKAKELSLASEARTFIQSGDFDKQPFTKQQALWQQAYGSNMPETPDQRKAELETQHKLRMKELGIMYPADRFTGGRGRNSAEQLWYANADKITDNVRAEYTALIQAAANNGDDQAVARYQAEMRQRMAQEIQRLGPMPGSPPPQPPVLGADDVDRYLGSLGQGELDVIVQNIQNPQFRAEFEKEQGVSAEAVFRRLSQSGFLNKPAPSQPAMMPTHRR